MKSAATEVLLSGPAGTGKAQPLDATVWTPSGPTRMGDLRVGDWVCTPDGSRARVKAIFPQGEQDVYRLTFSGGERVECTADHLWEVFHTGGGKRNGNKPRPIDSVRRLADFVNEYLLGRRRRPKFWVRQTRPVDFDRKPTPVDPYLLGVLLGDGSLREGGLAFTTADAQMIQFVAAAAGDIYQVRSYGGYHYGICGNSQSLRTKRTAAKRGYVSWHAAAGRYMARARLPGGGAKYIGLFGTEVEAQAAIDAHGEATHREDELRPSGIWNDLRQLGLLGKRAWEKSVPEPYLRNAADVRLAVLQGLMDTDGTADAKTGMPSFTSTSRRLAEDVRELVESLGGVATMTEKQPPNGRLAYTCWIRFDDGKRLFRLDRKRERVKVRTKYPVKRMLLSVEKIRRKSCQCISVDSPNGLYLTDHFVVTHNSRAALEKIHLWCDNLSNVRALIVRKTRESLTESALVTFEEKVVPVGHHVLTTGGQRKMRQAYYYRNGSVIVVGGMDKAGKIMSTEYDLIYPQEAIELTENDWESLTTRLRNGIVPYQQLLADTNPDRPTHWLKRRCDAGKTLLLDSRHEDNPLLWDAGQWTPAGAAYLAKLDALTGPRRQRLRFGRWVQAEGVVYDGWDAAVHLKDRFPIPPEWPRYWSVDFGYTNPMVVQFWAQDPDGRLYLYREFYHSQRLVEDVGKELAGLVNEPRPRDVICDHDAEDRRTFERHAKVETTAAYKDIRQGIQAVAARLRRAGDDKPRLFIMRDAANGRDPFLVEKKLPTCTAEEIDGYVWDTSNNRKHGEEPVDKDNHGMDAMRYLVSALDVNRKRRAWVL